MLPNVLFEKFALLLLTFSSLAFLLTYTFAAVAPLQSSIPDLQRQFGLDVTQVSVPVLQLLVSFVPFFIIVLFNYNVEVRSERAARAARLHKQFELMRAISFGDSKVTLVTPGRAFQG